MILNDKYAADFVYNNVCEPVKEREKSASRIFSYDRIDLCKKPKGLF